MSLEPRHRYRLTAIEADAVRLVLDLRERLRDPADLVARLVAERIDDLGVFQFLGLLLRVRAAPGREVFFDALQAPRELRLLRDELGLDLGILVHS